MNKARKTDFCKDKEIFVISDLHIGNGSPKDNLLKRGREKLLYELLDYIDSRGAKLVILGDFLELWRHRLDDVVGRWSRLLDRLDTMDVIYVLGNHDADLSESQNRVIHPFFNSIRHSFIEVIGQKRFKFMHGHELDPIISKQWFQMRPLLCFFAGAFEFREDSCLVTSDAFSDALCEIGEQFLRIWYGLTGQVNSWANPSMLGLNDEKMTWLKRPIRVQNMLGRFYLDKSQGLYDAAVSGHTHKAGYFGDWYFNSGCWTQPEAEFLKITPDGQVGVYFWTQEGACENHSTVIK